MSQALLQLAGFGISTGGKGSLGQGWSGVCAVSLQPLGCTWKLLKAAQREILALLIPHPAALCQGKAGLSKAPSQSPALPGHSRVAACTSWAAAPPRAQVEDVTLLKHREVDFGKYLNLGAVCNREHHPHLPH